MLKAHVCGDEVPAFDCVLLLLLVCKHNGGVISLAVPSIEYSVFSLSCSYISIK